MDVSGSKIMRDAAETGVAVLQSQHIAHGDHAGRPEGTRCPAGDEQRVLLVVLGAAEAGGGDENRGGKEQDTSNLSAGHGRVHRTLGSAVYRSRMPRIGYRLLLALALMAGHASAEPLEALRRGVNITNWFRYPQSRDPAALSAYLDDAAMERLRKAGFTFVRLAVQSDLLAEPGPLTDAIRRLERHELAVVVALFPAGWQPEDQPDRLLASWRTLAPLLRTFDPSLTVPEVVNEPVFVHDDAGWAALQHAALVMIRGVLPTNRIVLTGADWGSVRGLLALTPEPDANVVYSFHFYDPPEFTSLGAYRTGLDREAMARLPFPASDQAACEATAGAARDQQTAGLMRYYCSLRWDAEKLGARIAEAGNWARRNHANVIAGEFGASVRLRPDARMAWLAAVRAACEQQGFGWALWGYDDSMGFAARPPTAYRFDIAILTALGMSDSVVGQ